MTLDTRGAVLEGVRIATGNSSFTFPPRSLILDQSVLNEAVSRSEYVVTAYHPTAYGCDIGDPFLSFFWSRNEPDVDRFDFDNFARRWNISPGSAPEKLGTFRNSPRLKSQVPNLSVVTAPFDIWLGFPVRITSFLPQIVENSGSFGTPSPGIVEISKETGELNFSSGDIANPLYLGASVYISRQSYFDRLRNSGSIGVLPDSSASPYYLFLNPKPGSGQFPRIRIGFRYHLITIEVPTENDFSAPASGTVQWASNTGKLKFSLADVTSFPGETVYYDGTFVGQIRLTRYDLGSAIGSWPSLAFTNSSLIGVDDPFRFCFFSNSNPRSYFQVSIIDSSVSLPTGGPTDGVVFVDRANGRVFMSSGDVARFGSSVSFVDSIASLDHGVAVQFFRSGVNSSGISEESDFTIRYLVPKQIITDDIPQAPFAMLSTVPLVDASLSFNVDSGPGSTGTFSGSLVDANNPTRLGFGYELDLEHKKITYSNRKRTLVTLEKDETLIKLPDSMVFSGGFTATKNGNPIKPGIDFDFDPSVGLFEFIKPVGENDPENVLGIPGSFSSNVFTTSHSAFTAESVNKYIFVPSGPNSGIYRIVLFINPHVVHVDGAFPNPGNGVVDLRAEAEIVADRFWQDFVPPYKKFSLVKTNSSNSTHVVLTPLDFSILSSTSQINIVEPARPDDVFQITYISLDSSDNGVTVTPTTRTEFAAFKVRQETAQTTSGSATVIINPLGKTVDTAHGMKVYIDGITQDPSIYVFSAPGSITFGTPFSTEQVTVDYWVRESTGGETNFNLLFSPLDLDVPKIVAGEQTTSFNGDQLLVLKPGGAILIDEKEIVVISTVSYDPSTDQTQVLFEEVPTVSSDSTSKLQVTLPITGSYRIQESLIADPFTKNTNVLTINGNGSYSADTVITVNGDPYRVSAVKYDSVRNKTVIMTSSSAKFNYLIPRITRTVRPVLSPGASFQTSSLAHMGYPFTLVIDGAQHKILKNQIDYQVGEGGAVTLKENLISGDILYALYVGRVVQPTGTQFDLNYAYGIAANDSNGLKGQRLIATYNLFSPDSFFLRIETIQSFLPEVIQELQKTATSNGSSGPNITNSNSLKSKDYGSPSLYFDEQHLGNLDVVLSRLLKFHNDLANSYEDILASFDGRVVGGTSDRFRFDGNLNNPSRDDYSLVTNDIDDMVLLYKTVNMTGFFTFEEKPVYGRMWENNNFSRFFPTLKKASAALNNKTGPINFGRTLGSFNVNNITSSSTMTSSRASAAFVSDRTGTQLTIPKNGDSDKLIPTFGNGQKIKIYSPSGVQEISGTVSSVSGTSPCIITISPATNLSRGSIVQDTSDPSVSSNHFYTPGRDIGLNSDNGQISNNTVPLPPPFDNLQTTIHGNEIMDCTLTYLNTNTVPARFPALDGGLSNDNGSVSLPLLQYANELSLLEEETNSLHGLGTATVSPGGTTLTTTNIIGVPDTIRFLSGPNSGVSSTVVSVVSIVAGVSTFTVVPGFPATDGPGSPCLITPARSSSLDSILNREISVIRDQVITSPASGALIGTIQSEVSAAVSVMMNFGANLVSSTNGSTNGSTLVDISVDFVQKNVQVGHLLVVPQGLNIGLYKILSVVDSHTLTIDPTAPFLLSFATVANMMYSVLSPWNFLSTKEYAFPNGFISKSLAFVSQTSSWASSYSLAGVSTRLGQIAARRADIQSFTQQISNLLGKDDKIYETRYLWITSRIDKKDGMLAKQTTAKNRRKETTTKLLQDQQKLLITSKLM